MHVCIPYHQDTSQQCLGWNIIRADSDGVWPDQHRGQLTHFDWGVIMYCKLSLLILFAGGWQFLNCFPSWGFWTDKQHQANILLTTTGSSVSLFHYPQQAIIICCPRPRDHLVEPIRHQLEANFWHRASSSNCSWRLHQTRQLESQVGQNTRNYSTCHCQHDFLNFIYRYEGNGPGEIGITLEGASFLDRSLETLFW